MLTRSTFLRKLFTTAGISLIPDAVLALTKQYERIYLLQDFVRGFKYYQGPQLLCAIEQATVLAMVREPDNRHDDFAIALYYGEHKIGYVPAERNEVLAKLLDAGIVTLHAEVQAVEPNAKTWENIAFTIYALRENSEPLPPHGQYLLQMHNPHYFTISSAAYFVEMGTKAQTNMVAT